MHIVTMICLGVLLIFNALMRKEIICPTNYMLAFWMFCIVLNKYSFISYYDVSDKTYGVILIGLFSFFLGGNAYRFLKRKKVKIISLCDCPKHNDINPFILKAFIFAHFSTTLYFAVRMISIAMQGYSFSQLRSVYQGYEKSISFIGNYAEQLVMNWIQRPLQQILPIIALILLVQRRYEFKKEVTWIVIDELIYVLYTQSRVAFACIVIYVFILNFYYGDVIKPGVRRILKISGLIVLVGVLILTFSRFSDSNKWGGLKSIVLYFGSGISLLNAGIEKVDYQGINSYGVQWYYGWWILLCDVCYIFGAKMSYFAKNLRDLENYKEVFVMIGPGVWMNAFYSFFYDFYVAFRWWGVVLGCLFFGFTSERRISKMRYDIDNTRDMVYGLMTCVVLFLGLIRWQFVSPIFCFSYIYLGILFNSRVEIVFKKKRWA